MPVTSHSRRSSLRSSTEESADFSNNFAVFDSGFVVRLADALVQAMLSSTDAELPAVPWAGDDVSAQHAFTERASGVRTDAVEHVKDTTDIEDGKDSAIRNNFRTAARRNGRDIDQSNCSHGLFLLLLHRFCNPFGIAQETHHVPARNFVNRFFVVASIQEFLSDQRLPPD